MENQYIINESTLTAIANAIRTRTDETEEINPLDFPEEIANIDISTEKYMRISDLFEYPRAIDEDWYTETEVAKVDALIEHFDNLGGDISYGVSEV